MPYLAKTTIGSAKIMDDDSSEDAAARKWRYKKDTRVRLLICLKIFFMWAGIGFPNDVVLSLCGGWWWFPVIISLIPTTGLDAFLLGCDNSSCENCSKDKSYGKN